MKLTFHNEIPLIANLTYINMKPNNKNFVV